MRNEGSFHLNKQGRPSIQSEQSCLLAQWLGLKSWKGRLVQNFEIIHSQALAGRASNLDAEAHGGWFVHRYRMRGQRCGCSGGSSDVGPNCPRHPLIFAASRKRRIVVETGNVQLDAIGSVDIDNHAEYTGCPNSHSLRADFVIGCQIREQGIVESPAS